MTTMKVHNVEQKKDLIFDVGMHKGEDTIYYLKRGYKVVGFEANPELVKENQNEFSTAISNGDLIIVEGAIIENPQEETVKFYVNQDSSVWGTVNAEFAERNKNLGTRNAVVEVKAIDFGSCIMEYGIPYFMKIDIEGADMVCLKILEKFSKKPAYLSIESDKVFFDKLLQEISQLEKLGYDSFKAVQQADVPRMKIPSSSQEGEIVEHSFSKEASGMFGSDLPGEWLTKDGIIERYKDIFLLYKRLGDDTFWQKNAIARKFLKGLSRLTGKHYPGWYDTHARHMSVMSE